MHAFLLSVIPDFSHGDLDPHRTRAVLRRLVVRLSRAIAGCAKPAARASSTLKLRMARSQRPISKNLCFMSVEIEMESEREKERERERE
jgi:hypothetical protein